MKLAGKNRGARVVGSKVDQLGDLLETEIHRRDFALGQKFLSTHEITHQFGVSAGTARKALGRLVDRGILRPERGSGYYLQQKISPPKPDGNNKSTRSAMTLAVVVGLTGQWGKLRMEEYLAAISRACERENWSFLRINAEEQDIEQAIQGRRLAGCLTFNVNKPLPEAIDRASAIIWGGESGVSGCSIMGINHESASRLAHEHLWDLGHHRTALVRPAAWENLEEVRRREGAILGMRKAYLDLGYTWSLDEVVRVKPEEMDGLYERLCNAGITGVYSEDWNITVELYRQAHRLGETIGQRLSVVASGGHDLAEMLNPRPARIFWRAVDYAGVVIRAFRELSNGTPLPPRLLVPVFLEPGLSARPPA
jgi:DNA-binding LacI/PurR family transcriptional regulator